MKTVVLYARICPNPSIHTAYIFEQFKTETDFTCVQLDASAGFDVQKEQAFINQFNHIILLFTMNWYNVPWAMSRYFAEVWRTFPFTLENKKVHIVVTTGNDENHYDPNNSTGAKVSVQQYLNNLYGMLAKLRATPGELLPYYGCVDNNKPRLEMFTTEVINNLKSKCAK